MKFSITFVLPSGGTVLQIWEAHGGQLFPPYSNYKYMSPSPVNCSILNKSSNHQVQSVPLLLPAPGPILLRPTLDHISYPPRAPPVLLEDNVKCRWIVSSLKCYVYWKTGSERSKLNFCLQDLFYTFIVEIKNPIGVHFKLTTETK